MYHSLVYILETKHKKNCILAYKRSYVHNNKNDTQTEITYNSVNAHIVSKGSVFIQTYAEHINY